MTASGVYECVKEAIVRPPGLPKANPTISSWQSPPDSVSNVRSAVLPKEVDIAIIGSGITGCSAARAIVSHKAGSAMRVAVLEARTAVSGATGRNGGHLISDTWGLFPELVDEFGLADAVDIARFSAENISTLRKVVSGLSDADQDTVEFRDVVATASLSDVQSWEGSKRAAEIFTEAMGPDFAIQIEVSADKDIAKNDYSYANGVGFMKQHGAAALSAYRLVAAVWRQILDKHPKSITLETETPVLSVEPETWQGKDGYRLTTPRGTIRASKVIHCTNGYTANLLPNLVGKLYPLRGTMSEQQLGPSFPQSGAEYSWTSTGLGSYDKKSDELLVNLWYAQQNPKSRNLFIGGEHQPIKEMLNGDDSKISSSARDHLSAITSKIFHNAGPTSVKNMWSGIMGFTADLFPFVGRLSKEMTGRDGNEEFIAAGFSGHGMDKCWLCGEAAALMALGEDVPAGFPKPFLVSNRRIQDGTPEAAVKALVENIVCLANTSNDAAE
uniref:FAD dependent oxidoreductase domain-containing protein n=1 Tax=Bionectria ochroleuca TaxID=29856 RepID=A0A8H7N0J5_BIOOC